LQEGLVKEERENLSPRGKENIFNDLGVMIPCIARRSVAADVRTVRALVCLH